MEQNKTRTYIVYAIGEIFLVVIGILIALQVNNWNESRNQEQRLQNYYAQIHDEISESLPSYLTGIEGQQVINTLNERSLKLLNSGSPDSLSQLKYTLGALGTSWTITLTYPILVEFMEGDMLTQVRNQELKRKFQSINWQLERFKVINQSIANQYQNTIEPYIIRNMNYQTIALEGYQDLIVEGGPEIDYAQFKDNLELWNLITLKLEMTGLYIGRHEIFYSDLEALTQLLEQELN